MSLDFQSIILKLQQYWSEQGCLIWQPYYTQVGAGTMNPATALRVLGPEPWNVAYVEPSVRPDDGRYGENPNRIQMHTQFQVILKPDPGNPQEIYLNSLKALGIDPNEHDIRFVEDNWESPALGAWGLGWEVWLDGQEITQFTYFQQAGGMAMDPVPVEITYGLERIAMALQKVNHFRDIQWNHERKYGDVHLRGEQEHSKYYFEVADITRLREIFDIYIAEANSALDQGLVLPAHDNVLKCSHTFNVLDTRGAIGVTERQALFSRMRDLSRRVAGAYYQQREAMGFPWIKNDRKPEKSTETEQNVEKLTLNMPFVLEIGCEELPVGDLKSALEQLETRTRKMLEEQRIPYEGIKIMGTPRRLVVYIESMAPQQLDIDQLVKGPPADRAFNPDGSYNKAAEGFARGKGKTTADLEVADVDGGKYVVVQVHEAGEATQDVLKEALPALIGGIKFEKSMRWNESGISFSRPVRWLMALMGNQLIPFEFGGLQSRKSTRGMRFGKSGELPVADAGDYLSVMVGEGIVVDQDARRKDIEKQVRECIRQLGGEVDKLDRDLLEEINLMVEYPSAFIGRFDKQYLSLPGDVLISVMKIHQRYFPVFDQNNNLMNAFIGVRNGPPDQMELVVEGNQQVVGARFADAAFFIKEDLKSNLVEMRENLSSLIFQFKLGNMLQRNERIEKIVRQLNSALNLTQKETQWANRAAYLCKADLMSKMVIEMTSLQGVMGQYYAMKHGEAEEVAKAIYEHYLPRYAGDAIPGSKAGMVVCLADRLDSLAGLFAAGMAPSGTKDPFGQRRAATGLVQTLIAWDLDFDIAEGIRTAISFLPIEMTEETFNTCIEFITARLQSQLLDQGYRYDVVAAVLAEQGSNPAQAVRAIQTLVEWTERSDWSEILAAYSRCVRITKNLKTLYPITPLHLKEDSERELYAGLLSVSKFERRAGSMADFFHIFMPLMSVINQFFDEVLVMSEDLQVRENRLGMLQRIGLLAKGVANFSLLEGF